MAFSSTPSRRDTWAIFPDTRWHLVLTLQQDGDSEAGHKALAELCKIYWRPLYAHARRLGNNPEESQDLTQSFLLDALKRESLSKVDHTRGRMRSYLLGLFNNHVHNVHRTRTAEKRGGGAFLFSLEELQETERHLADQKSDTRTPEALYEYECALATVTEALNTLARDEHAAGRGEFFDVVRPFLDCADIGEDCQQETALRLGIRPSAFRTRLNRLRQRLGESVRQAVRETLSDPTEEELTEEMRHLRIVLMDGAPSL